MKRKSSREMKNLVAFYSAASAGLLSGSIHAVTGPDHFTAILPLIVGVRWWNSGLYGGIWGFGHGLCSVLVGFLGFSLKEFFLQSFKFLVNFRFLSDLMIGVTLIVIGLMGVLEATETKDEDLVSIPELIESGTTSPSSSRSQRTSLFKRSVVISSLLINGFLMGLSWDGLPSLAPAMFLGLEQVIVFLLCYLASTTLIMTFASGLIGESTCFLSASLKSEGNEQFSNRLTLFTSCIATFIGMLWMLVGMGKACCILREQWLIEPLPESNDGLAHARPVNNDGELLSQSLAETKLMDISSLDFCLNLAISVLSMVLISSGIVLGVFYPNSLCEQRMRSIGLRCHELYQAGSRFMLQRFPSLALLCCRLKASAD